MDVIIPASAVNTGIFTSGIVYIVLNTCGDVSGLFVSKVGLSASVVAGSLATLLGGPAMGVITAEVVSTASEGYFVPAVKVGSRLSALGISAGAGLAAGLVVTLTYHAGRLAVKTLRSLQKQDVCPIDFSLLTDGEFSVITLEAVQVGGCNTRGTKGEKIEVYGADELTPAAL